MMLLVMRKLLWVAAIFALSGACAAQENDEIRVDIVLRGADTVPENVKRQIVSEVENYMRKAELSHGLAEEVGERLRDEFQQHGYFKAEIIEPQTWPTTKLPDRRKPIELVFGINEGAVFRCGDIHFASGTQFSETQLRPLLPLKKGDIFDVEKMRIGIKQLREYYGERGFINFMPVPNTDVDNENNVINVTFDLDEGAQYRMGILTLDGEEPHPGVGKKILEAWEPHVGQIFDSSILTKALDAARGLKVPDADMVLANALREGGVSGLEVSQDNKDHTVIFHLEFPDPR